MTECAPEKDALALEGGSPVRKSLLPYGRQTISEADVTGVLNALRSNWLTTGPLVREFEDHFAHAVGAKHAVAVSSGTAALHTAMHAIGIAPGDEVIVPAITFVATANAVLYQGAAPVFADVLPDSLLIDPESACRAVTSSTRAIAAVDYAGQPCDYDSLHAMAVSYRLSIVSDACHALGAKYRGRPVGTLGDVSAFSFHPVKPITTGEGGMITTDDAVVADRMRMFRNHGITSDYRQREREGTFEYDMADLGLNYRLTDLQCALGLQQLQSLERFVHQRRELAKFYDRELSEIPAVRPLHTGGECEHAYHLYVVVFDLEQLSVDRGMLYKALRAEGIGVNVHYRPVYLHSYYQRRGGSPQVCPNAEWMYRRILTLPLFAGMQREDAEDVVMALRKVVARYRR